MLLALYSIDNELILLQQQQTVFENIEGNGEIARNEQFLLFPQCFLLNQIIIFKSICNSSSIYVVIGMKCYKCNYNCFTMTFTKPSSVNLITQTLLLTALTNWLLKTLWEIRRKCWYPAFSPFSTMFSTY